MDGEEEQLLIERVCVCVWVRASCCVALRCVEG